MDGRVYRLGVALHKLDDPATVLGVGDRWILAPEQPWSLSDMCTMWFSLVLLFRKKTAR
jgi:hypothetical protein